MRHGQRQGKAGAGKLSRQPLSDRPLPDLLTQAPPAIPASIPGDATPGPSGAEPFASSSCSWPAASLPRRFGRASPDPRPGPDLSGPPARIIGLLQGPILTEILFPPTTKTRARFAFAGAAGVPLNRPDAECLVFGWGSAAFDTSTGTYANITAPPS